MACQHSFEHLNFTNTACPECGEDVDSYGNTESDFQYCCFPDCGCDGARLCMAGEANDFAMSNNVEGMWRGDTKERREAVFNLVGYVNKGS